MFFWHPANILDPLFPVNKQPNLVWGRFPLLLFLPFIFDKSSKETSNVAGGIKDVSECHKSIKQLTGLTCAVFVNTPGSLSLPLSTPGPASITRTPPPPPPPPPPRRRRRRGKSGIQFLFTTHCSSALLHYLRVES